MPSNVSISAAASHAALAAIADLLDGGSLEVFDGSLPADCAAADSGAALAALAFGTPAFGTPGAVSTGRVYAEEITSDGDSAGTGDATHYRCKDSGSAVVIQGTAGDWDDDPDLVIDPKTVNPTNLTMVTLFWLQLLETAPDSPSLLNLISYDDSVITSYDGSPIEEYA